MGSLFITGSSGFIGRELLKKINFVKFDKIYCLQRSPSVGPQFPNNNCEPITGDLCDPDSYSACLEKCESVIHLAAVTGKAPREDYFRVNHEGTRSLIQQCERHDVNNFLYVSTIAVRYSIRQSYYYAQSKALGEEALRNSKLRYAIVRPTIVLGKEGSIWKRLSALSRKSVLLIPGNGKARIQPVSVQDLVECILAIVYEGLFSNEIFEIGGPDVLSFEAFLRQIFYLYHEKEPFMIHIPLKPLKAGVGILEKLLNHASPINVGQLSAFENDGIVQPNDWVQKSMAGMKHLPEILRDLTGK